MPASYYFCAESRNRFDPKHLDFPSVPPGVPFSDHPAFTPDPRSCFLMRFLGFADCYRPQRSCGKIIFLHLSVILFTGGVSDPSMHHRSHDQGISVRSFLSRGSLSRGSLSMGLCPWGSLSMRGHCPWGFLSRKSLSGGSLSGGSLSRGSLSGGLCLGGLWSHMVKSEWCASYWNPFCVTGLFWDRLWNDRESVWKC